MPQGDKPGSKAPPDGLPMYRLLTGPDDAEFCHRVSAALALGYRLHRGPTLTFDGARVIAGQALVWPAMAPSPTSGQELEPALARTEIF